MPTSDFLRLNGITLTVSTDGADGNAFDKSVEPTRALSGGLRMRRHWRKGKWSFKTPLMTSALAQAWCDFIEGVGHSFSFEASLYSSKGLAPSALTNATLNAGNQIFGASSLRLASSTGTITYPGLFRDGVASSKWTVAVYRKIGAAAYNHHVISSSGSKWLNGATSVAATTWLTVTTGSAKFDADAAANTYLDDLVLLPFEVPSTWPVQMFNFGEAFSDFAFVKADGVGIRGNTQVIVGGEVQQMPFTATGDGFRQSLEFSLMEK